jgi:trk system potassium uptake protein TrkA
VLIAGATRTGLALASRLEKSLYDVTALDEDERRCVSAAGALERATVIHGSATDSRLLEEEGVATASAVATVSDNHQLNVVASLLARRLGAARTFALVDDPALSGLVGDLGIDTVISPRLLTVGLAVQFFRRGKVRASAALMEDVIEIVEVEVPQDGLLTREPLARLGLPRGSLVAALLRSRKLIVPTGADSILAGHRALLITTSERAQALDEFLVA